LRKITKFNIILVASVFVVFLAAGYFLLPSILGDTVYSIPQEYIPMIRESSAREGVDPALVAGILMQESHFNPNAVSSVGAKGISQFMDGTARTMARRYNMESYNIYDASTGILFCAGHVKDLLINYNGDVDAALSAYNAGGGNVNVWYKLGMPQNYPSRSYINKIKNYRDVFAALYPDELGITNSKFDTTVEVKTEKKPVFSAFWGSIFQRFSLSESDK
jgi:soluble lytic murein transglycosylase